jgi:hypothetical protein
MSKKHHGGPAPVPPGNKPQGGPGGPVGGDEPTENDTNGGAPFQEQDEKRRLGGYGTAGEHPIQQPGRLNDGDTHSK